MAFVQNAARDVDAKAALVQLLITHAHKITYNNASQGRRQALPAVGVEGAIHCFFALGNRF